MSTLPSTQIEELRARLQAREQQLSQELQAVHDEQAAQAEQTEDMPREPDANQSTDQQDREVRQAEKLRDQQELQAVKAALQRVAEGSYGECVKCGNDIAAPRLMANPAAARCIDCQTKEEAKL